MSNILSVVGAGAAVIWNIAQGVGALGTYVLQATASMFDFSDPDSTWYLDEM